MSHLSRWRIPSYSVNCQSHPALCLSNSKEQRTRQHLGVPPPTLAGGVTDYVNVRVSESPPECQYDGCNLCNPWSNSGQCWLHWCCLSRWFRKDLPILSLNPWQPAATTTILIWTICYKSLYLFRVADNLQTEPRKVGTFLDEFEGVKLRDISAGSDDGDHQVEGAALAGGGAAELTLDTCRTDTSLTWVSPGVFSADLPGIPGRQGGRLWGAPDQPQVVAGLHPQQPDQLQPQ